MDAKARGQRGRSGGARRETAVGTQSAAKPRLLRAPLLGTLLVAAGGGDSAARTVGGR